MAGGGADIKRERELLTPALFSVGWNLRPRASTDSAGGVPAGQKAGGICSPLTGVTSDSWDTPAGHRVYDACRGFSVSWVCRGSGASIVSSTSC